MGRRGLTRAALLLAAALAAFGGAASFALGTCHDSGGFCADEFSSTHVEAYAGGVLLLSLAVGGIAAAAWLRLRPALVAAAVTAGAVSLAAVLVEIS